MWHWTFSRIYFSELLCIVGKPFIEILWIFLSRFFCDHHNSCTKLDIAGISDFVLIRKSWFGRIVLYGALKSPHCFGEFLCGVMYSYLFVLGLLLGATSTVQKLNLLRNLVSKNVENLEKLVIARKFHNISIIELELWKFSCIMFVWHPTPSVTKKIWNWRELQMCLGEGLALK